MIQFKKLKNINLLLLIIIFFQIFNVNSQVIKDSIAEKQTTEKDSIKKTYFKFSTSYLSNYVYNGRKDSISTPYIIPFLGYYNKNGFNASLSAYYLNIPKERKFDFFSLDANYDYEINKQFSVGIIANKTFYSQNSSGLNNNIKGILGLSIDYDFDFIEMYIEADLLFFKKKDYGLNIDFTHEFEFESKNNKFKITPTLDLNFSTLNYFGDSNNLGRRKKNAITNTSTKVENNRFTLLDFEFSIPISFEKNKFTFFITPTLVKPTNSVYTKDITTVYSNGVGTVTAIKNSTPLEEIDLKTSFFVEFGIFYKFNL